MFSSQLDGGFTSSQSQSTETLDSGSNKSRFVQPVLPLTVKQISEAYNSTDDKYSTLGTFNFPLHFAVDLVEAKMLLEFNPCLSKYSTFNGLNSSSTSLSPPRDYDISAGQRSGCEFEELLLVEW